MNKNTLPADLFLLVGYLLTSAHGLYGEPAGYGPFRLLDAAGRLVAIMKDHGLTDPFLEQLQPAIDAERFGNSADEELRAALNELSRQYAQELRNRLSTTEEQN